MSRQFPDTSGITLAVGSAGVLDGAWSFAAIVRQTTRSTQSLISQQASGGNRGGLWLTSSGLLQASSGAGNSATFGITLPLNVWALVAITRAAGPNKTPRGHMYRYDTGVWAHANGNAALDNDTTAITHIELGRSFSDWFYIGLMANAGVWDRVLSDVDVEGLELALQAWVDATPAADWPLNQASTATAVQDIIGAADQTSTSGTSVSADEPAGWSYTLGGAGPSVAPDGVAVPVALGSPSLAWSGTVAPAGIATPVALGSPTAAAQSTATPDGIAVPVVLGSPSLTWSASVSPDGISAPITLGSPIVGAASINPDGIAVPVALGSPSLTWSGSVAPSGMAVPVAVGSPIVGAAPVAPDGIGIPIALGAPSLTWLAAVSPDGISVPVVVGGPGLAITGGIISRPFSGTVPRPFGGSVLRPFTGLISRPFTGDITRP